ncbi:MAG: RagB/SusD family nutrient uptake outer membrane protein [Saprospiraceae bacterium]
MKNTSNTTIFLRAFAAILAFSAFTVACEKEVTDLQPFDRITETAAFATPERCALSMVGVYDAAQSGFYAGGAVRGYPFGAANVEQGDCRGEDMLNVAAFYAITYEATYNPTTANNQFHWESLYGLINKCNIVIDGVQGAQAAGVLTEVLAKGYEGEARLLRALAHHELLVHFARPYAHTADASHLGVPYRTRAVNTAAAKEANQDQGRNSVKECYDLLIADLDFAEQNLPATRAGTLKISRATKGAASALKTRVYQHMGRWDNVLTEAAKVTGYTLTAAPEGPFATFSSNSESIFSIENASTDNSGVNGALPVMYAIAPGRALVAVSPIIYNAPFWDASDLRRTQLTKNNNRAYFSNKYRLVTTQDDWNPIIRYAEVVLNAAEAQLRKSGPDMAAALTLLNQVRNRAVTDPAKQYTAGSFADAKAMLKAVLNERRIEFLGEGRRWADIHRLAKDPDFSTGGIPAKVLYNQTTFASWAPGLNYDANGNYTGTLGKPAILYDDFRFIWPIPVSELNTNPVLAAQQNPGY